MLKDIGIFFKPKSIAIVGASSRAGKPGYEVINNIVANGYEGEVFLVNPKGGEILGYKVYRSIEALPDGIDLAVIILPARDNPVAIRACVRHGIKNFVLAAGGFKEVDEQGEAIQDEIVRIIEESGIRVIGPNTSGHTSTSWKFTSSFFPLGKVPHGSVSYVAQTGNFSTHTMRHIITHEHFGVARVIGIGNKLDIDESDALEYLVEDDETRAIIMYLESIKNPKRFMEVADRVTRVKPVIVLKSGRSERGSKAAVAHTAAMASNDKIIDGAFKQVGITRIYKYSHLIYAGKALSYMPLPNGKRVSLLAPSGAMLVSLTDFCQNDLGIEVPDLEESSRQKLQDISPDYIRMRNPVDIWPAAATHGIESGYGRAMEIVLDDPNIDAVVPVLMLVDRIQIPSMQFIVDIARKYPEKPIYVTFSGDKKYEEEAKAFLETHGVPTFPMIEEPFEVLEIMARCRRAMERG